MAAAVCASDLSAGDVHRSGAIWGCLLSGGQLDRGRRDDRTRQGCQELETKPIHQADSGAAVASAISPVAEPVRRTALPPAEAGKRSRIDSRAGVEARSELPACLGVGRADVLSLFLRLLPV